MQRMPRQKLARKPAQRRGTQGQVQERGPQDPVHQAGAGKESEAAMQPSTKRKLSNPRKPTRHR